MSKWSLSSYDRDEYVRGGVRIDKNKYCKKNKLESGKYGPHEYDGRYCRLCGKINPELKNKLG